MKELIYRIAGRLLHKLTVSRNEAWETALRTKFRSIHPTTVLEYPLNLTHPERIQIGRRTRISWYGKLRAVTDHLGRSFDPEILIGDDCYIGNHVHIVATTRVWIGEKVMLADRVFLSDNIADLRNDDLSSREGDAVDGAEVHIGDGSWIGENVSIVGDIRIGQHCVVGANAIVTRSLPAYSVAVGAPARIIKRYSFTSEQWKATDPNGCFLDAASDGAGDPRDSDGVDARHASS